MLKDNEYAEYESFGKICFLVNKSLYIMNEKTTTGRSVRNWLTLQNTTSKYKKMGNTIRTNGKKGRYTKYNMHDVKNMLIMDRNIDIDGIIKFESAENQEKMENEARTSSYLYYPILNKKQYNSDESFRDKVDQTVLKIKTSIALNLMLHNEFDKALYKVDEDKVQASAMQHVIRDKHFEYAFPVTIEENDTKVLTGDLSFYLKKA